MAKTDYGKNEEISNTNPHNEYNKHPSLVPTLNPSNDESELNRQMNVQYKDSLESDGPNLGRTPHEQKSDPTEPMKGFHPMSDKTEHPIYSGKLDGKDQDAGVVKDKVDYHYG